MALPAFSNNEEYWNPSPDPIPVHKILFPTLTAHKLSIRGLLAINITSIQQLIAIHISNLTPHHTQTALHSPQDSQPYSCSHNLDYTQEVPFPRPETSPFSYSPSTAVGPLEGQNPVPFAQPQSFSSKIHPPSLHQPPLTASTQTMEPTSRSNSKGKKPRLVAPQKPIPLPNIQDKLDRSSFQSPKGEKKEGASNKLPTQPITSTQKSKKGTASASVPQTPAQRDPCIVVDLDLASLNAIPSPLPFVFPDNDDLSGNPDGSTDIPDVLANNVPVDSNNNNDVHMEVKDNATEVIGDDDQANNEDEMDQIKLEDRPGLPKGRKQRMLAAHLDKKCHDMDLEELRKQVRTHGHYACLIAEEKVALDAAFYEYQRQINIIAFQHLLKIDSVEEYLGQASRSRTTTIYNNFCQYDPEASKIHLNSNMRIQEQWSKCGALWCQLDSSTQLKFNDPEFLATLPNPCLTQTTPNAPKLAGTSTSNVPKSAGLSTSIVPQSAGPPTNTGKGNPIPFKGTLSSHTPTKKGQEMMTGGSPMGKAFLDMFAIDPNPCGAFLEFVKGQAALKKILGCEPPLPKKARKRKADMRPDGPSKYDLGNSELNRKSLSNQLGHAIFEATNGRWRNGWRGTKTEWRLNELGVQLRVKRNNDGVQPLDFCKKPSAMSVGEINRLLKALGEGWVELLGRPTDGPDVIGDVLDDDNDNRQCVKVRPVPPGGYVPPSKVQTQSSGQKKSKKPVTSNTGTTKKKPNKRVKTNQGKSVRSTVNEDESDGLADVNNATVSKTSDNTTPPKGLYRLQPPAARLVAATDVTSVYQTDVTSAAPTDTLCLCSNVSVGPADIKLVWATDVTLVASGRRYRGGLPGQRPAAVQSNNTTRYKPQLRKVQNKKKKVAIVSSEESEAEETPGELSESEDRPAESSNEDSDAEEHSDAQKDSNPRINHQDALRQPVASDSSRPPRPSTPASDTSSDISLNALKKRRRIQLKRACNKAVPQ
ncbi:hypothetical protein PCASD_26124 [Puccinia coronata f. sp. avenae]|uniref:Uncharacterized protein n=1 Tax=Puccinia coronata f. sp. avenae TaxID=200324 RepID=A0A2N5RVM6_9BASI|nr:hypothetical protein PCASD_26124 [Puccinia coronata f. sp. avenae]